MQGLIAFPRFRIPWKIVYISAAIALSN